MGEALGRIEARLRRLEARLAGGEAPGGEADRAEGARAHEAPGPGRDAASPREEAAGSDQPESPEGRP